MSSNLQQTLLNETLRIGDELLTLAEPHEHGLTWKTMGLNLETNEVTWSTHENIYSGVCGIVLFFLELYRQSEQKKYLKAAVDGMDWVIWYCQQNPTHNYGFLTGRLGVAYTLLKLTETTQEKRYLNQALELAYPCATFLKRPAVVNDVLSGTAGTVLVLLHIHAATGDSQILAAIDGFVKHLIRQAHYGPVGLYWDLSRHQVRGLCGFSHGAAGIGFVFLELGHYFQNEAFYWLAEQAFLYESHCFDIAQQNWPDFRRTTYLSKEFQSHKEAYLAGDLEFFTQGSDLNVWCHGAVGVGLARLRAVELLEKTTYVQDAKIALEKTKQTNLSSQNRHPLTATLCHGLGGNAELFLEAYKTFQDEQYLTLAQTMAAKALKLKEHTKLYWPGFPKVTHVEDRSLFMGNAGIAYFYLKVLNPDQVPSILLPKVETTLPQQGHDSTQSACFNLSQAALQKMVLEKGFKRSVWLMEQLDAESINDYCQQEAKQDNLPPFINFMKNIPQKQVVDIFNLELKIVKLAETVESMALLYIKQVMNEERAKKLIELESTKFCQLKLKLDQALIITSTAWSWDLNAAQSWVNNLSLQPKSHALLLRATPKGVLETPIAPFVNVVLLAFQFGAVVTDAWSEIKQAFEVESSTQEEAIKAATMQQIRQALLAGILVLDE